jgi:hypothetical protein
MSEPKPSGGTTCPPMPSEDYFLDNYGACKLGGLCICINPKHPQYRGWLGRWCSLWTPSGARSWEDLDRMAKREGGN